MESAGENKIGSAEKQTKYAKVLELNKDDAYKLIRCESHIGAKSCGFQCREYMWKSKRKEDDLHIIDIKKMWNQLILAARAFAAVDNPADICVISSNPIAQRALLKFAVHTGATAICGRFVPGSLTNQMQKKNFKEPRLLVVADPRMDHQAVTEAAFVNVPVIAFCNSDSPLKFIDIAIPCNNQTPYSIGLMWWFLAREVLYLKGTITRELGFFWEGKEVMADLYFHRDAPEQTEETKEDERMGMAEEPKSEWDTEVPVEVVASAREQLRIEDLHVPDIGDWAAASTFPTSFDMPLSGGPSAGAPKNDDWGNAGGW